MATLTKDGRQITVPDTEIGYYATQGWQSPGGAPPVTSGFPEGPPEESWKAGELKAYADAHEIDLGDATTKKDILPLLVAALDESAASGLQEPEGS